MSLYSFFKNIFSQDQKYKNRCWKVFFNRLHLNPYPYHYDKKNYCELIRILLVLIEYGETELYPYQEQLNSLLKENYNDRAFLNLLENIKDIAIKNSPFIEATLAYEALLQKVQTDLALKKSVYPIAVCCPAA